MHKNVSASDAYSNQVAEAVSRVADMSRELDRIGSIIPKTWADVAPVRAVSIGLETVLQNLKKLHTDP